VHGPVDAATGVEKARSGGDGGTGIQILTVVSAVVDPAREDELALAYQAVLD
jgi:hypothetical protein